MIRSIPKILGKIEVFFKRFTEGCFEKILKETFRGILEDARKKISEECLIF